MSSRSIALLNIFVCGPGQGEAIVVALPESGWLVIDGVGSKDDYPVHVVLDEYSAGERIELVLLTHPHRDHFYGLRELLERDDIVARTRRVGCVARHVGGSHAFLLEVGASEQSTHSLDVLKAGKTRSLLERVRSLWAEHPEKRFDASEGAAIRLSPAVNARVLSPAPSHVDSFFAKSTGLARRITERANDLSAVLELTFGDHSYIFGADLPETRRGSPVASGWGEVLQREPALHEHAFLKLPHHGSEEAQPLALLHPHRERVWTLTPFNSSRLPRLERTHGAGPLLERQEGGLHLTALPRGKRARAPLPATLSLASVKNGTVPLKKTIGKGLVPIPAGPGSVRNCEGYWQFGFDSSGALQDQARGSLATRLVW